MKLKFKIYLSIFLPLIIFIVGLLLIIPLKTFLTFIQENSILATITATSIIFLIIFLIFLITRNIASPISEIKNYIQKMNLGKTDANQNLSLNRKDEFEDIAKGLSELNKSLNMISDFAIKIKSGDIQNFNLKAGKNLTIGKTLTEISDNLITAEKEKKYSLKENTKIQWFQNGISDLTKLLQQDFKNTVEMSESIIKKLVKYIEVEQGGIFILHKKNEKENLILEATYAYDKKKKLDAEIEIGEGLVGKCAKEKKTIKIEDLPEGYTFIGSGLGEDTPKSLVLIPLLFEKNIFGVIEIASLKTISEFKINFLKNIGERIAAEISSIQIEQNTKFLYENFKKQAEKLSEKEKEMQLKIKELQDTRDEISKQAAESTGIMKALVSVASVVFYDMEGRITNINQKNIDIFNLKKEDWIGKTHFDFLPEAKENPEWFKEFWEDLRNGKSRTKEYYIKNKNKEMWLFETFTPILDSNGKPEKIINIGIDITKQKLLQKELISYKNK